MMKKLLSLCFTGMVCIANSFGQASCTPSFSCLSGTATEGICPDSATGIPAGTMGIAYTTSLSIKIPASYTYSGTTYNLTHLGVTEVTIDTSAAGSGTYVPLSSIGLNYVGNGVNTLGSSTNIPSFTMTNYCYWTAPGGACVIVSGTPNKSGTFPIKITSQVRVNLGFGFAWFPAPDNTDYKMVVANTAGIETLDLNKFEVKQNTPNPFNFKSEIAFSSLNSTDVDFKVYNMLGKVMLSKTFKAEKGSNTISLDASSFSPGIYVYSIKNGDKTITKRMIVSNK
jgi:hypothetical protein